jgi:hypothetical protein
MQTHREILEAQLESYEEKCKSLGSYLTELKATCEKHGTPEDACVSDRSHAAHNAAYYQGEMERIKQELGKGQGLGSTVLPAAGTLLPQTRNQGIGAVLLSSISFVAGALLGSTLKSGKSKER